MGLGLPGVPRVEPGGPHAPVAQSCLQRRSVPRVDRVLLWHKTTHDAVACTRLAASRALCDAVFEFRVDPTSSLCEFKTAVWLIIITMTTVPNSPTALLLQQRCCNGTEGSLRKLPQRPRSCLVLSYVACMLYVVCCMDSRRLRAWLRRLASHRHVRQRTTAAYDATDNTQHNKRHMASSMPCSGGVRRPIPRHDSRARCDNRQPRLFRRTVCDACQHDYQEVRAYP